MFGLDRPNRLLQPWKNVKQFSEELYAMFTSKAPVEHEGPVTIKVKDGETALRLVRGEPGRDADAPSSLRARPIPRPQPATSKSQPLLSKTSNQRVSSIESSPIVPPKKYRPLLSVEGGIDFRGSEPVRFDTPPQTYNPKTKQYEPPPPWPDHIDHDTPLDLRSSLVPLGGTLVGRVLSGTGKSYQVALYPKGPTGSPGDTVEVVIPQIDPKETIPRSTWMFGIAKFSVPQPAGPPVTTYFYQPAVWMD
jgi:hypothetical protein